MREPHILRRSGAQGVHGISTREVYPPSGLRRSAVRSYRTFSPLPQALRPEAVIFCDPICASTVVETPPVRWRGALCCPDFPPRPQGAKAAERFAVQDSSGGAYVLMTTMLSNELA